MHLKYLNTLFCFSVNRYREKNLKGEIKTFRVKSLPPSQREKLRDLWRNAELKYRTKKRNLHVVMNSQCSKFPLKRNQHRQTQLCSCCWIGRQGTRRKTEGSLCPGSQILTARKTSQFVRKPGNDKEISKKKEKNLCPSLGWYVSLNLCYV